MQRLHARYPFLDAAREAVEAAAVDLGELVAREDAPAVERAVDRVRSALSTGTVGDRHRSARVELLSYPVARVLVSLVDQRVLTQAYARAEAATAHERFVAEITEDTQLRSTGGERLGLDRLLREFDLGGTVRTAEGEGGGDHRIDVGAYLRLSTRFDDDEWALTNRALADGAVPVSEAELLELLRGAVEERVAAGLPLSVPDPVAAALADEVATIREELADLDVTVDVDAVVPGRFPPCITHLVERLQGGESLPDHSRFALASFLASIGADGDDAVALCDVVDTDEGERLRRQVAAVRGDEGPTMYAPPTCETMVAYGDCVNKDDLCAEIAHPLSYYERRLDEGEYDDWRETGAAGEPAGQ
jgi:DNA primase large subunit